MSSELRELYQEVILDHSKRPRNLREIVGGCKADGVNPLCGDKATVYLALDGDVVKDASFVGRGCSISTASASMMTEILKGKTIAEVQQMFERFHGLVTTGEAACEGGFDIADLDKLVVLAGVREFPMRVKCASLPWHTMKAALAGAGEEVSTE